MSVGNLEAIRDFSDVRDIVRAYWLATEKCKFGEPYNIGSGQGHRIGDMLNALISFSGVKVEIKQDPNLMRPSDVPVLICDSGKFKEATGWQPEINFDKTLRDTLDYWRPELI